MRASTWFLALAITGCKPSAIVQNTMPVANLQSYRTVALTVKSTAFASQGHATFLENAVIQKLRMQCGFSTIARPSATPSDVVIDLNITQMARGGGGGLIQNGNQATMDTLLVLTDGLNGDLLGTARIRGRSSGLVINNERPENEAIEVIAKSVADLLAKSGCAGPRIARAEPVAPPIPEPTPPGPGSAAPDEARLAEAEALNEQGKEKLRSADVPGALAAFGQANALVPDARYQFNLCLAHEAEEQWGKALAACRQAKSMNPQPQLVTKIDRRLSLLEGRK